MLAECFFPISLAEMNGVALLNRLYTKFVMTTRQLWEALTMLQPNYWMLEVDGVRLNRYRTLYFDTPDFDLYHAHVNKRPERYKVRSREYADSGLAFLEVKHRTRKDRTIKERVCTPEQVIELTPLEFQVLKILMHSAGRVVKRADLAIRLMETGYSGS